MIYILEYKRPRERRWKPIVGTATTSFRDAKMIYKSRRNVLPTAYGYRIGRYARASQRR